MAVTSAHRPAWARVSAHLGLLGVAVAVITIGLLHFLPPWSQVSAVRRTISEYALLPDGWVFDVGVLALAAGSLAVLAALVGHRLIGPFSPGAVLLAVWSVSLVLVVAFPKHNWAVGPSMSGSVHRVASVVAFLSLPLAAIAVGRATRSALASWLGVVSLLWFGLIIGAVLLQPLTGVPWWRAIPLGAVERGLVLTEVIAVACLALVSGAARRRPPAPLPATA